MLDVFLPCLNKDDDDDDDDRGGLEKKSQRGGLPKLFCLMGGGGGLAKNKLVSSDYPCQRNKHCTKPCTHECELRPFRM